MKFDFKSITTAFGGFLLAAPILIAPAFAQGAPEPTTGFAPGGFGDSDKPILADAGRGHHRFGKGGPRHHGGGFAKLNLTDDQKSRLGKIKDDYTLSTATKSADLKVAMRQLFENIRSGNPDKSAALASQDKINGLKGELAKARLNMMLASSDVFTPEQKAQMKEMHRGGGCGGGKCGPGRGGKKFGAEITPKSTDAKPVS